MSSAAATLTPPRPLPAAGRAPSLARLTAVELRKMLDTRSGLWLQIATAALTVLAVIVVGLAGHDDDRTLVTILRIAVQPAAVLLPIAGILLVSSEWSQRTTLITFTLVPQRGRVIAAKAGAGAVVALGALAVCLVAAVLGTAVFGSGVDGTWSLSAGAVGQVVVFLVTAMITGIAFGAALLSSAPAIVLYFALPTALSALGAVVSGLHGLMHWIDPNQALSPLTDHLASGLEWGRVGIALAVWMVLPLLIGVWRVVRSELK